MVHPARGDPHDYHRLLRPGGCLAFAVLGPGTFRELVASFHGAAGALSLTASPQVAAVSFPGEKTWQTFLADAGFQEVTLTRQVHIETHPSVQDFLHALQATGATNPIPQPLSPRLFRHMAAIYRDTFGASSAIPATYEVIWARPLSNALPRLPANQSKPTKLLGKPGAICYKNKFCTEICVP